MSTKEPSTSTADTGVSVDENRAAATAAAMTPASGTWDGKHVAKKSNPKKLGGRDFWTCACSFTAFDEKVMQEHVKFGR